MELRLFTPEQANALRPYLEAKTRRIRELKKKLDVSLARSNVLSIIAESGVSEDNPDLREQASTQDESRRLAREIQQEVEAIQTRGCVVKDLDHGLVDFYSLHGDRLVFLCWKSGEEEVSYWHSLTGGYASRRPIEAHDEA